MTRTRNLLFAAIIFFMPLWLHAQKGTGNTNGVASSNTEVAIENISGKIQKIITEPCTQTTGRFPTGIHMLVETLKDQKKNTFNVHLGPADMVSEISEQLSVGQSIELSVFSTEDLPENHYIAKKLSVDGKTFELRDDDLRPFWAKRNNRRGRGRR
jgi:hypothetical protein